MKITNDEIEKFKLHFSRCARPTIFDRRNGTPLDHLFPPILIMPKWRVFASSHLQHCFCGGERGLIVPFCHVTVQKTPEKMTLYFLEM